MLACLYVLNELLLLYILIVYLIILNLYMNVLMLAALGALFGQKDSTAMGGGGEPVTNFMYFIQCL